MPLNGLTPPTGRLAPIRGVRGAPLPVKALSSIEVPIDAKRVPQKPPLSFAVGLIVKSLTVWRALSKSLFLLQLIVHYRLLAD